MSFQNIDEVIAGIHAIIAQCKTDKSRAGYFAALYLRMTIAVKEGILAGKFEDAKRMELLDVCFAERYTTAWDSYSKKQPCTQSWQFTFDSTKNPDLIVLQCLLLGINTHINLDLAIAAATIAPGDSIYKLEKDFNRINDIIGSLMDDIQECLTRIWQPMRLLVPLANGKQYAALNFSIDKARTAAWSNAVLLANMTPSQQAAHIKMMDGLVKTLATKITNPGAWTRFLLRMIRKTEFDNPTQTITLIETVVV